MLAIFPHHLGELELHRVKAFLPGDLHWTAFLKLLEDPGVAKCAARDHDAAAAA